MQRKRPAMIVVLTTCIVFLGVLLVVIANNPQVLSMFGDYSVAGGNSATLDIYPSVPSDIINVDGAQISSPAAGQPQTWIGSAANAQNSYLGLRFVAPGLPSGAQVTSAKLAVTVSKEQWINVGVDVYALSAINPGTFTTAGNWTMPKLTTQKGTYSQNVKWLAKQYYTIDVTAPVKEALSLAANQNSVALIVKNTSPNAWSRKFIVSEFTNKAVAPKLTITYTLGATNPTTPPLPTTTTPSSTSVTTTTTRPSSTTTSSNTSTTTSSTSTTTTGTTTTSTGSIPTGTPSHALGMWTPSKWDTCPKETHDKYSVVGPDGKLYPTWHPAIDPATGCKFGHEHGRDPKESKMYDFIKEHYAYDANGNGRIDQAEKDASGIPFGYANEQLDVWNAVNGIGNGMRHEDHVGHKVELENTVEMVRNACGNTPASDGCFTMVKVGIQCDFLMKVHQGTHSPDAFGNNLHELAYFVKCTDGTQLAATTMVAFGAPGEFAAGGVAGGFKSIKVGTFNPANSPTGAGLRSVPTIDKVREHILVPNGQWSKFSEGLYEDWISSNYLQNAQGKTLAYYDPHFAVFGPSRFYDPSKPNLLERSIDVCFMTENNGTERARGGECETATNYGQIKSMAYDDPRSPFNGCKREFYFNQTGLDNAGGSTTWYTDAYGKRGQTTPFVGSVKQYVSSVNNSKPYWYESQAIGAGRNYCGNNSVHAPN